MKRILKELGRDKTFRLRKCKPYILAFCVLFALLVLLGSTLAWYTTADTVVNSMETPPEKHFLIHAVDVFDPGPENGIYHKRVGAANMEEKPGLVRLMVIPVFVIDNPEGPPTLLPATIGWGPESEAMVIMDDYNDTDWIDATDLSQGGDGYFYYRHVLAPGDSTDELGSNLFNLIALADPLPEGYENAHLVIEVKCEAVGISPPEEYLTSWWDGVLPSGVLYDVYEALLLALGLA